MSRDLRNTSLASQAAQLKRTLENRDKRRQADKIARLAGKDDDDERLQQTARGPVVNQSVATLEEISQQESQRLTLRCDLCQAEFLSVVAYEQHCQSAVHKKAVEKQQAELARQQRLAQSGLQDMTAMALGAAAWSATHDASALPRTRGGPAGYSGRGHSAASGGRRGGRTGPGGRGGGGPSGSNNHSRDVMSHEEMTRSLRQDDEELHIDGWVPPAITTRKDSGPSQQHAVNLVAEQPTEDTTAGSDSEDNSQAAAGTMGVDSSTGQQADAGAAAHQPQEHVGQNPSEGGGAGAGLLGLGYDDSDDSSESSSSASEDSAAQQPAEGRSFF